MGTNYYFIGHDTDDPAYHIGKRSGAGLYCYKCDVSLCKGGKENVHYGKYKWYDKCPVCGDKRALEEKYDYKKTGPNSYTATIIKSIQRNTEVKSCCSFSWAMHPSRLEQCLPLGNIKCIWDEYHEELTLEEMLNIVNECPIKFYNHIGSCFS